MNFEVTVDRRRGAGQNVSGGDHRRDPVGVSDDDGRDSHASEVLRASSDPKPRAEGWTEVTLQLVVNTGKVQVMTSGDLEDRVIQMLVHLERDHVKWTARGPEEDLKRPYSLALRHFRKEVTRSVNSGAYPESPKYSEAISAVAAFAGAALGNFPRERNRLLGFLSGELGWQKPFDLTHGPDDEDWRSSTH